MEKDTVYKPFQINHSLVITLISFININKFLLQLKVNLNDKRTRQGN